jgi:hypothetical protein
MLREKGVKEVFTAHQGVNIETFRPAAAAGPSPLLDGFPEGFEAQLAGAEFVIFSGGKLEHRKGQVRGLAQIATPCVPGYTAQSECLWSG